MTICVLRKDEHDVDDLARLATCGRPVPWVHVKLLDDDLQRGAPRRAGRDLRAGPAGDAGLLEQARADGRGPGRRLAAHRRHRPRGRARLLHDRRPQEGHDRHRRLQRLPPRGRGRHLVAPGRGQRGGHRRARRALGRGGQGRRRAAAGRRGRGRRADRAGQGRPRARSRRPSRSTSPTRSPSARSASPTRRPCAPATGTAPTARSTEPPRSALVAGGARGSGGGRLLDPAGDDRVAPRGPTTDPPAPGTTGGRAGTGRRAAPTADPARACRPAPRGA